ncbi:hypothetical protein [Clostridium sp. AWRP]|uniref:hypothetical protein n=1 Tax=Clostridium sp. AWRP TaxID=2212991 RepID=UPI0015865ABE|nr:hypothetical protein [Clostridium sp. AWRP]
MAIIILLIIYIMYLQKLHCDEIKTLYNKLGIETETIKESVKPSKVKNHIKKKMIEMEHSKGGE